MATEGDYRVIVWDLRGYPIAQLETAFECAWGMNEATPASFTLSTRYDDKANPSIIRFGYFVTFEHKRLPPWVGVIAPDDGLSWNGNGELVVRCRSAEFQFARRRMPRIHTDNKTVSFLIEGNPDYVLRQIIRYCNETEDTRIRVGKPSHSTAIGWARMLGSLGSEAIANMLSPKRQSRPLNLELAPSRDEHGRLIIYANLTANISAGDGYVLQEDINLETPSGEFYREDGTLINDMAYKSYTRKSGGFRWESAQDRVSRAVFGLWQGSDSSGEFLEAAAFATVANQAYPRRSFTLTAVESIESPDTFSHLRLGHKATVLLHSVGFRNGAAGAAAVTNIQGMEYDTEENKVIVTAEVRNVPTERKRSNER